MNNKKPTTFKRMLAFMLDFLLVSMLSGVIAVLVTNEIDYDETYGRIYNVTKAYSEKELTIDEYNNEVMDINYDINQKTVSVTIVTVAVSILYYIVFAYACDGQTLGKKIVKIKVVSKSNEKASISSLMIRSMLIDMILVNALNVILILTLSKENYISIYDIVNYASSFILLGSAIFMMYRDDGKGIHDLVAGTVVVNCNKTNDVLEGQIVSEKKENK